MKDKYLLTNIENKLKQTETPATKPQSIIDIAKAAVEKNEAKLATKSENNSNFETPIKNNGQTTETGLDNSSTVGSEPERLPLGTITAGEPVARTIEKATNQRTVGGTNEETSNKPWSKSEGCNNLLNEQKPTERG